MDLYYFKERLHDELNDACEYAKKGIELQAMTADWSKQFMTMSAEELDHANKLYKMFAEYVTRISDPYSEQPKYIKDVVDEVNGFYPDMVTKVKMLHEMYR